MEERLGRALPVKDLNDTRQPILARIPIHWDGVDLDDPISFRLSVLDTRSIESDEDLNYEDIAVGQIEPGTDVLEIRVPPGAVASASDLTWASGSMLFGVTVVDSQARGHYTFERWHPSSTSARNAKGLEVSADKRAKALERLEALGKRNPRWFVEEPPGLNSHPARRGQAATVSEDLLDDAEQDAYEFLTDDEAHFNADGVTQGLVVTAMLPVFGSTSGTSGAPGSGSSSSAYFTPTLASATPSACGDQPYLFSRYNYKNNWTKRWMRIGSVQTRGNTTVDAKFVNSRKTKTQTIIEYAGRAGNASLTGYQSFGGSATAEFDLVRNWKAVQFRAQIRYNYYRNQCPDLSGNGRWYDLPESEYIPSRWTGGVYNASLSSVGWSCNSNYTVNLGRSLNIGHNRTRSYSSGITASLLGVKAGAKQTTQNDSSYFVKYVEDSGANGRVCGRYTDPIYTTLTREP